MTTSVAHRFRSVQIRTTAIAMVTVVVVLLAGAAGVASLFERQQIRQVDTNLDRGRDFVRDALRAGHAIPDVASPNDLAQFIDKDGKVLFATPRLRGLRPAWTPAVGDPSRHRTVSLPGVGRARVTATPIGSGWLVLLSSLSTLEAARSSLRTALALAVPLVGVALAFVVWLVVGRALRPVHGSGSRRTYARSVFGAKPTTSRA